MRKGYVVRKCRRCGTPFVLGPLDPDVYVCPFHAVGSLRKNNPHPRKAKPIKNPFTRMQKKLRRRRR